MEAAYSVYLWKDMVEKAKSFDVREGPGRRGRHDASTRPEGLVTIDGENQHITKTARSARSAPTA